MNIHDGLAHYDETLSLTDVDRHISDLSRGLELAADKAVVLNNLGAWRQARYERSGDPADIEAAIELGRAAVRMTPPWNSPDRVVRQLNLGNALLSGMDRSGEPDRLQEAVSVLRSAGLAAVADTAGATGDVAALVWASLCDGLRLQAEQSNETQPLVEAVAAGRRAVDFAPRDGVVRPSALANYGNALRAYANHTAQWANLDEAVQSLRGATASTGLTSSRRLGHLADLATALLSRFELRGELRDLDEAVDALNAAVANSALSDLRRPARLSNLASALDRKYQHLGVVADLRAACEYDEAAVDATDPQERRWPGRLSNLASRLMLLFHADGCTDRSLVDKAVQRFQQALQASPEGSESRWRVLTNLGNALRTRSYYFHEVTDLSDAFRFGSAAVIALPVNHPQAATCAYNLAVTLRAAYSVTKESKHSEAAVKLAALAASQPTAPTSVRITAAVDWAKWAASTAGEGSPTLGAADGYAAAVALLPLLTWWGLRRESKEAALRKWSTLPTQAAAHVTESGQAELAVRLLEVGRSVIWGQMLDLRADLADLRQAYPELGRRLEAVREGLDGDT